MGGLEPVARGLATERKHSGSIPDISQKSKAVLIYYEAVFRIHDILVWIRIRGSMPLTNRSGSFYFSSLTFKTPTKLI
jgi:hypothetical protein